MDAAKKRKWKDEPPVITYETDNRAFDRLFKEDSLDGLKEVVRRKLNLTPSVPLSLLQLRNGKAVDLEDDDDFEAFTTYAHATAVVRIKVVVGHDQVTPSHSQTEVPLSSSKRKRKKKAKSSQDNSPVPSREPSKEVTPAESSADAARASKKRRVSFVDALPETLLKSAQPSTEKSRPISGSAVTVSEPLMTNVAINSEQAGAPEALEKAKKKKKKKKDREAEKGSNGENEETVAKTSKETPPGKKDKDASSSPPDLPTLAQQTDQPGEPSQPAKSKKRRRDSVAMEPLAAKSVIESSNPQATEGEERPSKKSKDKHIAPSDSGNANTAVAPPKAAKPKSKAQSETGTATGSVQADPKKEPKKRKKKEKESGEFSVETPAPRPVETVATTKKSSSKGAGETAGAEQLPKSKSAEASTPVAISSEIAVATDSSKKSKQFKKRAGAAESNNHSQPTEHLPPVAVAERKHSNTKGGEDSAKGAAPADAKTPKKPRKKDVVITEDAVLASDGKKRPIINKVMEEATKRAVAAISANLRNKQAERTNGVEQPDASPDAARLVPPAEQPVAQGTDSEQPADEIAQATAIPATEPEAPAKCPLCGESPTHVRTKCPTIKAGIRSMRKRILELQAEKSEDHKEERQSLISELQAFIDKKTRKPRTSEVAKSVPPPEPTIADADEEHQEAPDSVVADPSSTFAAQLAEKLTSSSAPPPSKSKPATTKQMQQDTNAPTSQPSVGPNSTKLIAVAQSPLSRPSIQPPSTKLSSRTSADLPQISSAFQVPEIISSGPLRPDFLGLGDISSFTDKDLDAIIRGPRVSLKDVPESDTEEENEEEPDAALEEDNVLETKAQRNTNRFEYPTSSDEGDEDEAESPGASVSPALETSPTALARPDEERSTDSDTEEMQTGNMSFQDVEANGSSRELDKTGDVAANDAVEADLAPLQPREPEPSETIQGRAETEADSDTAVASQAEGHHDELETCAEKQHAPAALPPGEAAGLDPIEPSEPPPPASPPEPIASDAEPLMQSTPRPQMNLRTRRQRGKAETDTQVSETACSQPGPSVNKATDAGEAQKSTRRGRGLTKLTELPVPPNPSVRIIRPAPALAPKTRRQAVQGSQEESRDVERVPDESNTRTTRSAAAAKAAANKTPAKTPAKASKTPAKAATKTPSQASIKPQSKTSAANAAGNTRSRSRTVVTVADPDPEMPNQGNDTALPESQGTVASWAVLQENGHSQTDTETPPMVDELLPSPEIVSTGDRSQKGQKAASAQDPLPEPLFVPADSQQSFPYSQYPDLHPRQATVSPNESDDEEEVAAAIRKPAASGRQSAMFRGLSEIASQPGLFVSRLSQQFHKAVKEPVENLYGRGGQDSEESDSESDSDAEKKAAASHIPASRRAGASFTKKK